MHAVTVPANMGTGGGAGGGGGGAATSAACCSQLLQDSLGQTSSLQHSPSAVVGRAVWAYTHTADEQEKRNTAQPCSCQATAERRAVRPSVIQSTTTVHHRPGYSNLLICTHSHLSNIHRALIFHMPTASNITSEAGKEIPVSLFLCLWSTPKFFPLIARRETSGSGALHDPIAPTCC